MKAIGLILVVPLLAGCASRYAHDPGAAKVGPAYLDYTAHNPRDRATEFYYPVFAVRELANREDSTVYPPSPPARAIAPLLIRRPEASPHVKTITGKGYPCLESAGMPVLTGAQ